jgi:hypothetical protein
MGSFLPMMDGWMDGWMCDKMGRLCASEHDLDALFSTAALCQLMYTRIL